uniref:Uncharacterized protein n=1 Tax=viral metagenome TaxID=1070528 RepID=A0A6C0I3G9_9ZZZZ
MKFSRTQMVIGLIILIGILVGILWFMNRPVKESESFTSLSNKTTPFDTSTSLFYLLYKKYPAASSTNIYDDLMNNFDSYMKNIDDVHMERYKIFKRDVATCIEDYKDRNNKNNAVTEFKELYKTINTDTKRIVDSCKGEKIATTKDWNKYVNSMFTNPDFLNHIFNGDIYENSRNIYISDFGFNNILYIQPLVIQRKLFNWLTT